MKKDYTHICVVLDASGSMDSIKEDVKGSIRDFVASQRNLPGEIRFDVYQFSDVVEHIADSSSLDEAASLMDERYRCSGTTALYDAVCIAIDELGAKFASMQEYERPEDVVFVIFTDGYENASRTYRNADVMERIKRQTEVYSWRFIFLGAEIDAETAAQDVGIDSACACSFARDETRDAVFNVMANEMEEIAQKRVERRKRD